ncbi:MAG: hypothetical protein ACJAS1_006743 [Oleiphilaceae bacterium]|jgi:hypothetical protein
MILDTVWKAERLYTVTQYDLFSKSLTLNFRLLSSNIACLVTFQAITEKKIQHSRVSPNFNFKT